VAAVKYFSTPVIYGRNFLSDWPREKGKICLHTLKGMEVSKASGLSNWIVSRTYVRGSKRIEW